MPRGFFGRGLAMRLKLAAIAAFAVAVVVGCGLGGSSSLSSTEAQAQPAVAPAPPAVNFTFATSGDPGFDAWRQDFAARAVAAGRSSDATRQLLEGLTPDPAAIRNDQSQAEFVRPWWDYVDRAVTQNRIDQGRAKLRVDGAIFDAVALRYGVEAGVIAGIWGIESNFGEAALPHSAPRVLATLAYEGRRRPDFERWLMALIEMVERGYAGPQELRSSWAGALGQPQFMPDVYLTRAVDWDGDGRRDIWTNDADVIASIANYLAQADWRRGEPAFQEVTLPQGFDLALADRAMRPISAYAQAGAAPVSGAWVNDDTALRAELFLPAGVNGPALLLHENFAAIRRYNPSDRYALAVALIGRRVEGGTGLVAAWPSYLRTINAAMTRELQTSLTALGYDVGGVDGVIGNGTRRGLRAFQQARGLVADGFPTYAMVEQVRLAQASVADLALNREQTLELQRLLGRLGYQIGRPDGVVGTRTRTAISTFERSLGRTVQSGQATQSVLRAAREFVG
jgi:membrane-bound lytic murein transglycosylase B